MKRWLLGLLLLASTVQAKTLIVADLTTAAGYTLGEDPMLDTRGQLQAVRALLDRFGASYKIMSPTQVTTQWCRTGHVGYRKLGIYSFDASADSEAFDAVVHLAFNGSGTSQFVGYRPDSLGLNACAPTVPQLLLMAEEYLTDNASGLNPGTGDSCGVKAASGYQAPGGGSGNHEGEGTVYSTLGPERWFDSIYGANCLAAATPPAGGIRVILASGMNSTFNTMERTGNVTPNPDSVGTTVTDTMKVWERLNLQRSGLSRVVYASAFSGSLVADSASSAGSAIPNTLSAPNWPVLLCAFAHLDSLAGGLVLGSAKKPGVGFVVTHAGDRSARAEPGGIHSADTTYMQQSCDSLKSLAIKVVVAADPESLATHPSDAAMWLRIGNVRFTPFVRTGIDTLALAASGTAKLTSPVDVWGRYRNRAFYGDSLNHTVNGADTSITAQIVNARGLLHAQIPTGILSSTFIAPDMDYSPYQMRGWRNSNSYDSLMFAIRKAGGTTIIGRSQGRNSFPDYLTTNPVGWMASERNYRIAAASLAGERVTQLCVSSMPVWGSNKFLAPATSDTIPPYCDVTCPGTNVAVTQENRFWNGFFPLRGRDYQFDAYDNFSASVGVFSGGLEQPYGQSRASVLVLPAQSLGGGIVEIGYGHIETTATNPTRPGWLIMKHIYNVVAAANRLAGRTIISQSFPEDIRP